MRRLTNLNYLAALAMAFAAITFVSCFSDEVVRVPDVGVDSNSICFGANVGWADEDEITRGAEARRTLNEGTISSEEGSVSLPLIVTQEDGIRTATPMAETRGAKVTLGEQVGRMRVWATHTNKDDIESNYFTSANADDGTVENPEQGVDFVRNSSGIYTSTPTFMWPGDGSFTFTAVANLPANIGDAFTASLNTAKTAPEKFTYRVPEAAEDQHDIMIAKAENVSGANNSSVPLNFQHIMAAVNFKVGSVVAGTIESITLKGIYNKAEYSFTSNEWTNRYVEDGGVFEANIGDGFDIDTDYDSTIEGTMLNSDSATFMMIPQQLDSGAEIIVSFEHDGEVIPIRASIQGNVWGMNTTTNYLINIDHNFELSIVPLDNVIDSHYVITRVEIGCDAPGWRLYGVVSDNADVSIQLEQDVNPMAKLGFWTDTKAIKETNGDKVSYRPGVESARGVLIGENEIGIGGSTIANQVIYVFIPENISSVDRTITLTLDGYNNRGEVEESKEIVLTQHPVQWYNPNGEADVSSMGLELLIEGGQVGWGFCWEDAYIDLYSSHGNWKEGQENTIPPGQVPTIETALRGLGLDVEAMRDPDNFISLQQNKKAYWFIRINLGTLGDITIAESDDNGWANTNELYHWEGIESLSTMLNALVNWEGIDNPEAITNAGIENSLDYATLYAMKRNRFHYFYSSVNVDGMVMEIHLPVIMDSDINWYLPATSQFDDIFSLGWGQSFSFADEYWTSTAYFGEDNNNAHAYAYVNLQEIVSHRNDEHLAMAVRRWVAQENVEMGEGNIAKPGTGGENGPGSGSGGNGGGNTGENPGAGVQ